MNFEKIKKKEELTNGKAIPMAIMYPHPLSGGTFLNTYSHLLIVIAQMNGLEVSMIQ